MLILAASAVHTYPHVSAHTCDQLVHCARTRQRGERLRRPHSSSRDHTGLLTTARSFKYLAYVHTCIHPSIHPYIRHVRTYTHRHIDTNAHWRQIADITHDLQMDLGPWSVLDYPPGTSVIAINTTSGVSVFHFCSLSLILLLSNTPLDMAPRLWPLFASFEIWHLASNDLCSSTLAPKMNR